jgi:hypothetical protein
MKRLADGTILNSGRKSSSIDYSEFSPYKITTGMLIGTIIQVNNVESKENALKSEDSDDCSDVTYTVKCDHMGAIPVVFNHCRVLRGIFGINNTLDIIHEDSAYGTGFKKDKALKMTNSSLCGSLCLVGFVNNIPDAPVIMGFLPHLALKSKKTKDKGICLDFEFNGIGLEIDKEGQCILKADKLKLPPEYEEGKEGNSIKPNPENDKIREPKEDEKGPITITIGKDQEFFDIIDGLKQEIKISLKEKIILISDGKKEMITIKRDDKLILVEAEKEIQEKTEAYLLEATKTVTVKTEATKYDSTKKYELKTQEYEAKADKSVKIKSNKIAIGSDSTELLETIYKLFDGLGKVTLSTIYGPTGTHDTAPQWASLVLPELIKLKAITGKL